MTKYFNDILAQAPQEAKKIDSKFLSAELIESGQVWIEVGGQLVNAMASPDVFDAALLRYIRMFDREIWPTYERNLALVQSAGRVPTVIIPRKDDDPPQDQDTEDLEEEEE